MSPYRDRYRDHEFGLLMECQNTLYYAASFTAFSSRERNKLSPHLQ